MLAELRKHAQTSAQLRALSLQKEAGLGKVVGKASTWALTHPAKAALLAFGTSASAGAAKKTYHSFNPAVQRAQLGMVP